MKMLITAVLATMILGSISPAQDNATKQPEKGKKPALEWKESDSTEFAKKLKAASAAGEKWTRSPESIILEFVGPFVSKDGEKAAASRHIRINTKGEDVPKTLNVVLVDNGLFDDSIKTMGTRLSLARQEDGSWKLRKLFRAQVKWPKLEQ
ncbi:MAG: hypothetical protein ACR2RV_15665 [Verrucomicrobiales bacterium]